MNKRLSPFQRALADASARLAETLLTELLKEIEKSPESAVDIVRSHLSGHRRTRDMLTNLAKASKLKPPDRSPISGLHFTRRPS